MRIVLLSGLDESTPPTNYGSVETLVYCAAKELVQLGHDVTVFATEDSADAFHFCTFRAYPLLSCGVRHRGLPQEEADKLKLQVMRLALQQAIALEPDVLHNNDHTGLIAWSEYLTQPAYMVTTAHWPFDDQVIGAAFRRARRHNVLTVSRAQQDLARSKRFDLAYRGTVYNCISHERFLAPGEVERTDRLAWIGRFDPMKGVEESIAIARLLDQPLVMAGKVDQYAKPYFDAVVQPLLTANRGLVEFCGEVSQLEASRIMASARAFLMTTRFHESFGLVAVEASAAGTPVVATAMGAMPELVKNGMNGFVVPMLKGEIDVPRFAAAVRACENVHSQTCRAWAERFRPVYMAQGYENAYETIVAERVRQRPAALR